LETCQLFWKGVDIPSSKLVWREIWGSWHFHYIVLFIILYRTSSTRSIKIRVSKYSKQKDINPVVEGTDFYKDCTLLHGLTFWHSILFSKQLMFKYWHILSAPYVKYFNIFNINK
jgi:hypothetical protein